jgi:para-aminobenzoate synthetase
VQSAKPHIILIDGKSGAGKTRLATAMAAVMDATIIHLDDVYPGWNGLVAGRDHIIESVLIPLSQGRAGGYVSWDWVNDQAGQHVSVEPTNVLIVEGCGISTPAARALADTVIWVDCPDPERVNRIRLRDGDRFSPYLAAWEAQVAAHISDNSPDTTATVVVRTTAEHEVGG